MKKLFVIVHENAIHDAMRSLEASRIEKELRRIKDSEEFLEIKSTQSEHSLPENMPPPSKELQVLVCGSYGASQHETGCCLAQLNALKKAGYNTVLYSKACFSSDQEKMVRDIEQTLKTLIEQAERGKLKKSERSQKRLKS